VRNAGNWFIERLLPVIPMKAKAVLMALAMMTTALAGCTGTDGVTEVDEDALNELIDANLQDFINNTTIVVNNHYHNNTTVNNNHYDTTNEYNNTTNVDGGEVVNNNQYNGSVSVTDAVTHVFRTQWNVSDLRASDYGSRDVVVDGVLWTDTWWGGMLQWQYNGFVVSLSLTCEEFVSAYRLIENSNDPVGKWSDWLVSEYGGTENDAYDTAEDIHNALWGLWGWSTFENYCSSDGTISTHSGSSSDVSSSNLQVEYVYVSVFEIGISEGEAVSFLSLPNLHNVTIECDDGFYISTSDSAYDWNSGIDRDPYMFGGQSDCIVSGIAKVSVYSYYQATSAPSDAPSWSDYTGWPGSWYEFDDQGRESYAHTDLDFLVIFQTHNVEVYDPDAE